MKTCSRCKKTEQEVDFSEKRKDYCKGCIKWYNRQWAEKNGVKEKFIPIVTDTSKQCCMCKEIKPLDQYSNSTRGRKGKSAYCKPCASKYQMSKVSQEDRRKKTQKYRDNNREWWRSLHRITQFNRRKLIKAQSDGTVTAELVKQLYDREICYYCENSIEEKDRTLEHKMPLSRGGLHSSENLTMCCSTCNNTKGGMTEEEFKTYKNDKG